MNKQNLTPSEVQYQMLNKAYAFFNEYIFSNTLPDCLIVFDKKGKRTGGYFAPERWQKRKGKESIDEIAINPVFIKSRGDKWIISVLVHEMAHLWQSHFGKTSRNGYHNKQWANKMDEIGLIASNTGETGGKRTGQQMSHYIEKGGIFDKQWKEFEKLKLSFEWIRSMEMSKETDPKKNKIKYTCECGVNVWGKPGIKARCVECKGMFESDEVEDEG